MNINTNIFADFKTALEKNEHEQILSYANTIQIEVLNLSQQDGSTKEIAEKIQSKLNLISASMDNNSVDASTDESSQSIPLAVRSKPIQSRNLLSKFCLTIAGFSGALAVGNLALAILEMKVNFSQVSTFIKTNKAFLNKAFFLVLASPMYYQIYQVTKYPEDDDSGKSNKELLQEIETLYKQLPKNVQNDTKPQTSELDTDLEEDCDWPE